ncbi:MAG: ester cyclase [Gammaproteobacteria bacterium]|nr:ester cyclase [Gammaproteobacteria bacterium]
MVLSKNPLRLFLVFLILIISSACFSQNNKGSAGPIEKKLDQNKKIMSDAYEKVFNQNNPDLVEKIFSEKYIVHHPVSPFKGLETLKQQVNYANRALAGYHIEVHDIFSENNKVVSRFTVRGKHVDSFFNIPATGNLLIITGMLFTHIEGNKIVEEWEFFDQVGTLQQLDAIESNLDSPVPALTRSSSAEFEWGQPLLKTTPTTSASLKTNKSLVYKMVDGLWNKRIDSDVSTYFSDKFVIHAPNMPDLHQRADLKSYWKKIEKETSYLKVKIEDIIAEDNIVAIRISSQFEHIPTERKVITGGIVIFKIEDSKIVECWISADIMGLYKQLGILPS